MNATELFKIKNDILLIHSGKNPKTNKWRQDDNGDWITINGTHVQLNQHGIIKKGPSSLVEWQKNNPKFKNESFDSFSAKLYKQYGGGLTYAQAEEKLRKEKGWSERASVTETAYLQSIGYTEKPQKGYGDQVAQMVADGCIPIYRGLQGNGVRSASSIRESFWKESEQDFTVSSENVFGSGTYFDTDPNVADKYSDRSYGSVICGCLKKDAKVIDIDELEERTQGKGDLGMQAAQLGYDAIDCSSRGPTHIVLVNRSAAVIDVTADSTSQFTTKVFICKKKSNN